MALQVSSVNTCKHMNICAEIHSTCNAPFHSYLPWTLEIFNHFLCFHVHRDSAIAFSDRIKSGVVGEQLWLQITEPTEKDMGKYAIEFNDGKGGLRRTVELCGQGETVCISDLLLSHSDLILGLYTAEIMLLMLICSYNVQISDFSLRHFMTFRLLLFFL